jgi:hypothetical protein
MGNGIDHIDSYRFHYELRHCVTSCHLLDHSNHTVKSHTLVCCAPPRHLWSGLCSNANSSMPRHYSHTRSNVNKSKPRTSNDRQALTKSAWLLVDFRLEVLEQASPYANPAEPRLHTCQTTEPTPNTRHDHALQSHIRPCSTKDQQADGRW